MNSKEVLRIAIISSPRAGNSWLRRALGTILGIPEFGYYNYESLPNKLPHQCVLQIHWEPNSEFIRYLKKHKFTVITITRHPLDILISVLNFAQYEPLCLRWIDGKAHTGKIYGLRPSDNAFIAYCKSIDAGRLLDISYLWAKFKYTDKINLSYEEVTHNKKYYLEYILKRLELPANDSAIDKAISSSSFEVFNKLANHHGWKGEVNNWRNYFTKKDAEDIYLAQKKYFEAFYYTVADAKSNLTKGKIKETWEKESGSINLPETEGLKLPERELCAYVNAYVESSDKNKLDKDLLDQLRADNHNLNLKLRLAAKKIAGYEAELQRPQSISKRTKYRLSFRNCSRIIYRYKNKKDITCRTQRSWDKYQQR